MDAGRGKESSDMNCSICFDPLSSGKHKLTMLDCYHEFHTDCLNQWLKKSRTCPICRKLALLFQDFPNLA
ncbi:hypothetical protein TCAL_17157 [Tigriopus californicus]|uniref:RING-type domain-containing protein n=1 Tax=Tigriopus californicus TaxID=6832 RepID=A0A553P4G6_TIGCA|nr:hypothetical protein TCAL_17157 [Tigriopus californicus]